MITIPRKTYRNQITTPELIEQINPKNKQLAKRFLKEKDTRSSDGTIKGYDSDLDLFFVWNLLNNENKFFVDIKKIEFADFFNYGVDELKWSPARFSRVKSCLSSFSNFIEKFYDEDYPKFRNVILKAIESIPKVPVREKTILKDEQIDELLSYLGDIDRTQEQCLLALAISSGARISEIFRINIDIIDVNNTAFEGLFIETTKQIKTKGRTKTGDLKYKYIVKDMFLPYFDKWMAERAKIIEEKGLEHNSLFIKQDGTPASVETARGWITKWEKFLGVPVYFHALRHYLVTFLTRKGLSSDFIIEIMGWKSGEMYKIYNDLTAKEREWKDLDKLKNLTE